MPAAAQQLKPEPPPTVNPSTPMVAASMPRNGPQIISKSGSFLEMRYRLISKEEPQSPDSGQSLKQSSKVPRSVTLTIISQIRA